MRSDADPIVIINGIIMALRGRKPTPAALKRIIRAPRTDRPLTTLVPQPKQGALLMPLSVANNPFAKHYWDHYVSNTAPGHLAPVDSPLLARLCMCLARVDDAEQKMGAGMIVKAPNTGVPLQSPWLAIINRQTHLARQLASELALPPAQRNRLGVNDAPDPGDVAESYFR